MIVQDLLHTVDGKAMPRSPLQAQWPSVHSPGEHTRRVADAPGQYCRFADECESPLPSEEADEEAVDERSVTLHDLLQGEARSFAYDGRCFADDGMGCSSPGSCLSSSSPVRADPCRPSRAG